MHRRTMAVVTTCVALVLVGCSSGSSPVGTSSASPPPATGKGVAPDTSSPSPTPTSVTPTSATTASTASTGNRPTPPPGLRDFGDAMFAVPTGFQPSSDYRPLTPLETDFTSHFLVPTNQTNTKEVIGVYVYTLPAARTVTAKTNQVALIKAYNTKAKAVVSGSIRPATSAIDGVPAYTETATEPGNVTYIAYWAFGTHHFLQFSCQLGSSAAVASLAVACGTTLASLELT